MLRPEFNEWLIAYCKRFAGVANMMTGDTSIASDWFDQIGHATIDQLTTATREIMALDPQPFPSDHLGKLNGIVKTLRFVEPRHTDYTVGRDLIDSVFCVACQDRGTIEIYQPLAYRPILEGTFNTAQHLRTAVVACFCERREDHQRERKPTERGRCRPLMTCFDRDVMKQKTAVAIEGQVEELTDFVTNQWKPRTRNEWIP